MFNDFQKIIKFEVSNKFIKIIFFFFFWQNHIYFLFDFDLFHWALHYWADVILKPIYVVIPKLASSLCETLICLSLIFHNFICSIISIRNCSDRTNRGKHCRFSFINGLFTNHIFLILSKLLIVALIVTISFAKTFLARYLTR